MFHSLSTPVLLLSLVTLSHRPRLCLQLGVIWCWQHCVGGHHCSCPSPIPHRPVVVAGHPLIIPIPLST
jgi:hypothetical protein